MIKSSGGSRVVSTSMAMLVSLNVGFLVVNGLIMLAVPRAWYDAVPGVVDRGFFNQHFIRDIGMIQIYLSAAFWLGLIRPSFRTELWAAATVWLVAHAFFHFREVALSICSPSVLTRDFPAVAFPALIGIAASTWSWRTGRAGH